MLELERINYFVLSTEDFFLSVLQHDHDVEISIFLSF